MPMHGVICFVIVHCGQARSASLGLLNVNMHMNLSASSATIVWWTTYSLSGHWRLLALTIYLFKFAKFSGTCCHLLIWRELISFKYCSLVLVVIFKSDCVLNLVWLICVRHHVSSECHLLWSPCNCRLNISSVLERLRAHRSINKCSMRLSKFINWLEDVYIEKQDSYS